MSWDRMGVTKSMWRVLAWAKDVRADRLLYCEDDIQPAPGAVTTILAAGVTRQQALVSAFDAKEFREPWRLPNGVHDVPVMGQDGRGLFGACCLLIPRKAILWALRHKDEWAGDSLAADQALSWSLRNAPWPLRGVHVPSLVEHIGDTSSMGHKAGQRASWFTGNHSSR